MSMRLDDALDKSGVQIFWEKIKNFFVTKEEAEGQFLTKDEITSVIEKDLLKVTIGTDGSYNSTGKRYLNQGKGAKLIMIFDSNGALGYLHLLAMTVIYKMAVLDVEV